MAKKIPYDPPFESPTDYSGYVPPSQLICAEKFEPIKEDNAVAEGLIKPTLRHIFIDDMARICKQLESEGFRRLSGEVRMGTIALVYEGNNHQMIRIGDKKKEHRRSKNEIVLQPLETQKFRSRYTLEVLPRVHTLEEILQQPELAKQYGLTDAREQVHGFIKQLVVDSARKGYLFFDPKLRNAGLIQDEDGHNVPIIVDADAIVRLQKVHAHHLHKFTKHHLGKDENLDALREVLPEAQRKSRDLPREVVTAYLDNECAKWQEPMPDYKGAQQAHLQRMGLDTGQANRVVTDAQMKEFFKERKSLQKEAKRQGVQYDAHDSVYAKMIKQDGLYPDEIGDLADKAAMEHERDSTRHKGRPQAGYCQHLEKQRVLYAKEKDQGR